MRELHGILSGPWERPCVLRVFSASVRERDAGGVIAPALRKDFVDTRVGVLSSGDECHGVRSGEDGGSVTGEDLGVGGPCVTVDCSAVWRAERVAVEPGPDDCAGVGVAAAQYLSGRVPMTMWCPHET